MDYKELLTKHLDTMKLPPDAQVWLLDFWDIAQGLDDWYDGDEVSPTDKQVIIYQALVLFPSNPFYLQYASYLAPVVSNMVLKWCAANTKEREGTADARSFMWRAAYYDVILEVVRVVHGPKVAMEVANQVADMYGEVFEEYLKEFK